MSKEHGYVAQDSARTVVDAEPGELDAVDEADEGDISGRVDAVVQLSIVSDGVAGVVELGVVDVGRGADVDEVRLPVETSMVSYDFHMNVAALEAYL